MSKKYANTEWRIVMYCNGSTVNGEFSDLYFEESNFQPIYFMNFKARQKHSDLTSLTHLWLNEMCVGGGISWVCSHNVMDVGSRQQMKRIKKQMKYELMIRVLEFRLAVRSFVRSHKLVIITWLHILHFESKNHLICFNILMCPKHITINYLMEIGENCCRLESVRYTRPIGNPSWCLAISYCHFCNSGRHSEIVCTNQTCIDSNYGNFTALFYIDVHFSILLYTIFAFEN